MKVSQQVKTQRAERTTLAAQLREEFDNLPETPSAEQRQKIDDMLTKVNDLDERIELALEVDRVTEQRGRRGDMWDQVETDLDEASTLRPDHDAQLREMGMSVLGTGAAGGGTIETSTFRSALRRRLETEGVTTRDLIQWQRSGTFPPEYQHLRINTEDSKDPQLRTWTTSTSTDPRGGYLIPTILDDTIYDFLYHRGAVRRANPMTITTMYGGPLHLPRVSAHAAAGTAIIAESAAVTATEDTMARVVLNSYVVAGRSDVTKELIQDSFFPLEAYIGKALARYVARTEDYFFWQGTGSSQHQGVIQNPSATYTHTTTGSNAIAIADVIDWKYIVKAQYLEESNSYVTASKIYSEIMKLNTGTGGMYPFLPSLYGGEPNTILGEQVLFSPYAPAGLADNDIAGVYGSWEDGFIIRNVGNFEISASPHARFVNREVVFLGEHRSDSSKLHIGTLGYLKIKA